MKSCDLCSNAILFNILVNNKAINVIPSTINPIYLLHVSHNASWLAAKYLEQGLS